MHDAFRVIGTRPAARTHSFGLKTNIWRSRSGRKEPAERYCGMENLRYFGALQQQGPLQPESWITFNHALLEKGPLSLPPQSAAMTQAIRERTTVRRVTALERARNADELAFHRVLGEMHCRVAMAAHVDEF